MKTLFSQVMLACVLLAPAPALFAQLQDPIEPVNIIFDDDMSMSVDDVGNHAVLWALANRGEVNVLALVCSSANDYSAPTMRAIANYYGHPNVLIGAHKGTTPILENSANSSYTQPISNQFGTPGDTRANYPDAVTVYRQALAGAPDGSVYIVASGYYQPLQALLQSQPDSISPLTGLQLVQQKVRRLISEAGWFPSGNEHNFRVDADAASFVFANWPGEIVSIGAQMTQDVITGPASISNATTDPIEDAWKIFNGGNAVPGFGQVALLYAVRGLGSNFIVSGFNGQTTVFNTLTQCAGCDSWSQTPNMQQSYLNKQATAAQLEAILNPLLQGDSSMPILRSISPTNVPQATAQTITLTGTNFFTDSQVMFNGSSRPTTFTSGTQVSVQLSSSDLAQAGSDALSVFNPENGGWTSAAMSLTVVSTAPTLTSISPSSAVAGSGSVTLTATGTNFASGSVVQVNGASRSTTFVSGTQLMATLTAADLTVAGSLAITVTNPSSGLTSGSDTFTVNNPVPSLSSISPNAVPAGSSAFTLTVTGTNFVNGSVVEVNGSNRTTTFASSTQLSASIPASDVASPGTLSITVLNSGPGGGSSAAVSLTVNNPPPTLSSISPSTALAGGPAFTLTANGTNFTTGSVIQVNGSNRTTTFVSSSQINASIPASDIASAGTLSITVVSAGGTSAALSFTVNNPVPSLTSISPNSTTVGGPAFTLTVNGTNFVSGSVVQVNGSNRTTTLVSSSQLTASIPASDLASAGTLSVTVVSPAPGGGASAALTFTVNNPVPSVSSVSPNPVVSVASGYTLTINGSGFVSTSVVKIDGATYPTTFVSSTQVKAQVANSGLLSLGGHSVTVFNPTPGGGTSNAVTVTVISLL
jgi:inosine-uridine nucleoside N-ribohydrolase